MNSEIQKKVSQSFPRLVASTRARIGTTWRLQGAHNLPSKLYLQTQYHVDNST